MISTIGGFLFVSGLVAIPIYLIHSLKKGRPAPANPWGGATHGMADQFSPAVGQFPEAAGSDGSVRFRPPGIRRKDAGICDCPMTAQTPARSDHADHAEHPPWLAHHFDTPEQQFSSAKLGMWAFLLTEVLFFSGLFCAYAVYRRNHPELFVDGHHFLNTMLGAVNTAVLLLSSFTMAWGVRCAQLGKTRGLINCLVATLLCAGVFLGIKYTEYKVKWDHHMVPGPGPDCCVVWRRTGAVRGSGSRRTATPRLPSAQGVRGRETPPRGRGSRRACAIGNALQDATGRADQAAGDVFRHLLLPDRPACRPRDLRHHRHHVAARARP